MSKLSPDKVSLKKTIDVKQVMKKNKFPVEKHV